MKTIGIICEYNPFHNGHIYHIEKIKEKYPDSLIILCLNGYFMQRGDISILSKEDKTKLALEHNIDLVIELPTYYGIQSADFFAYGALKVLNALNVKTVIFGSETNDIKKLTKLAKKQLSIKFDKDLNENLNYAKKLEYYLQEDKINPNDLLGISYIKASLKEGFNIDFETIKRTNNFHDLKQDDTIISAQNIRNKLKNKESITKYIPNYSNITINNIDEKTLFNILKVRILTEDHLDRYIDVVEGLDNKLKKEILTSTSLEELISRIKSKRYTYTRIKRMLMHILLGIRKDDIYTIDYVHILGFNKKGKDYLNKEKNNFLLPIKPNKDSSEWKLELSIAKIYDILTNTNSSTFDTNNHPYQN